MQINKQQNVTQMRFVYLMIAVTILALAVLYVINQTSSAGKDTEISVSIDLASPDNPLNGFDKETQNKIVLATRLSADYVKNGLPPECRDDPNLDLFLTSHFSARYAHVPMPFAGDMNVLQKNCGDPDRITEKIDGYFKDIKKVYREFETKAVSWILDTILG